MADCIESKLVLRKQVEVSVFMLNGDNLNVVMESPPYSLKIRGSYFIAVSKTPSETSRKMVPRF
jgi:hypothetical protein